MNDIEIFKKLKKNYNTLKKDYNAGHYSVYEMQFEDFEAIENLIQRNKELEQIEKEHKKENGRLREENKNLEKELEEKDMQHELELIGKEEFTKANMAEIIEHYYTANEDCIPISKVEKELIQLNKDEKTELKGMKGQDRYFVKQQYAAKREILEKVLKMKGR